MRYLLVLLLLAGVSCGGGSDDGDTLEVLPTPTPLPPQYITCSHEGDILICDNQGNCMRDSEEVVEVEELERSLYLVKYASGNVTIIAECGSNVTINSNESTSYPAS